MAAPYLGALRGSLLLQICKGKPRCAFLQTPWHPPAPWHPHRGGSHTTRWGPWGHNPWGTQVDAVAGARVRTWGLPRPLFSSMLLKTHGLGQGSGHRPGAPTGEGRAPFPQVISLHAQILTVRCSPVRRGTFVQPSSELAALSPSRDGKRITGAGGPCGSRGFGEFLSLDWKGSLFSYVPR